jgi:glycosyltransferase involved in cell wall biosynthesis
MKLLVTACQVPFIHGGADYHIDGLTSALRRAGHQVEQVRFPFKFTPTGSIEALMRHCEQQDFSAFNGIEIDKVISLQFPGYGVRHPDHRVWIMHQHRAVYELFEQQPNRERLRPFKDEVTAYDNRVLARAARLFANSATVARRLRRFNGLTARPLYHPPPGAERFYCAPPWDYIFFPSRLETLKRQSLLIEAARHLNAPVRIILGGTGGQEPHYRKQIEQAGLSDKVLLTGRFSEAEKYTLYARALAVFFGPFEEDYGYITLEAMLSAKPVITCTDSGGPLEFVRDGETGYICPPEPEAIAAAIDTLYHNKNRAIDMGQAGRAHYHQRNISWSQVVSSLLADN